MRHLERNDTTVMRGWLLTLMLSFAACSGDSDGAATIVSPGTPSTPVTPTVTLTLSLTKQPTDIYVLDSVIVTATITGNVNDTVLIAWKTSDATVADLTAFASRSATVVGKRPGAATITATLPGLTATIVLSVLSDDSAASSLLVVESFRMIEFQYPGSPGWLYAPLIRVRETSNVTSVTMTTLDFEIPGLGSAPRCTTSFVVGAGQGIDLFEEIYGDYQYVIFSQRGTRASGAAATAIIRVVDERGRSAKIVVTGPVVSGQVPTTFSGGNPKWICS